MTPNSFRLWAYPRLVPNHWPARTEASLLLDRAGLPTAYQPWATQP